PVPQLIPSYASLKFMAVGTPTVAGENYPHSPCDAWFNQGIGCMFPHYVAQIDLLTGDTCFTTTNLVQSTTSIGEITETEAYIYPNPTNEVIYLNTDASFMGQSYILIDNLGRKVLLGKISESNTAIETTNLSKGIYLLSVGDSKKQNFRVIKE
ncbi:MAG: T9SS type A sorting domain-containing protein, partial [Candidatus Methylopumilus sp.]